MAWSLRLTSLLTVAMMLNACGGEPRVPAAAPSTTVAAAPPESVLVDARQQLAERAQTDQSIRDDVGGEPDTARVRSVRAVDSANVSWLKAYVTRWQWPTVAQVGKENVGFALQLLRRAIADTAFMRVTLPVVTEAARRGELDALPVAMLVDSVEVQAGRKQRYGTRTVIRDGRILLEPIEDSANVDKRRAELGITPVGQTIRMLESAMQLSPPKPRP